ncbi:MAG: S-adenosylmethionine decarboxylase proenzyme [Thermococcales archaeon 44_46]|jgi:S-adenosylmethionine decarboxylase|uniref:adenosylmethionine decarboxylase n=1 Tax=Thermococcus TaxID=2263 RepID=UPI0005B26AAB|nr:MULTISPECIES: adenosylmethionine decarboxylase [Thermococcus]KUJ99380.1 MAG: S-adenosylmethionine decarboxylase proenzyme [Thermococcales archaeon 44_46]MDK2783713.1 S-adenosylmethionine decarboxylase [Thermococcaceae archaeon]MCA6213032.1 S-adenosylmethionine decarboxylase proenzyme [Thermococcus bergensis]MDK2983507.1 S-adenosylmethionine decarboxylase [Thermococcaceae archaeon]MPW39859.1 S-adenosylmethionine decarboxylase proenzyme [Thermococcus sp. 101 C5]
MAQVVETPIGMHVVLDLYECDPQILDDIEKIEEILTKAAEVANATIIDKRFHKFSPQGVSGVVVVSESHIAIHTWPEHGYAAVDVYTCGDHTMPLKASEYIIKELKCKRPTVVKLDRGLLFKE